MIDLLNLKAYVRMRSNPLRLDILQLLSLCACTCCCGVRRQSRQEREDAAAWNTYKDSPKAADAARSAVSGCRAARSSVVDPCLLADASHSCASLSYIWELSLLRFRGFCARHGTGNLVFCAVIIILLIVMLATAAWGLAEGLKATRHISDDFWNVIAAARTKVCPLGLGRL